MKNLFNIEDTVKVSMPGFVGDGAIAKISSMQQWPDGGVHYCGTYHEACPDGGEGFENSIQFTEDQCILVGNQKGENITPKQNTVTQKHIDDLFNKASLTENVAFHKCLIVTVQLQNGFIIIESSACVDEANFDIAIGREICCDRIKNKLWELEGYKLQCELSII